MRHGAEESGFTSPDRRFFSQLQRVVGPVNPSSWSRRLPGHRVEASNMVRRRVLRKGTRRRAALLRDSPIGASHLLVAGRRSGRMELFLQQAFRCYIRDLRQQLDPHRRMVEETDADGRNHAAQPLPSPTSPSNWNPLLPHPRPCRVIPPTRAPAGFRLREPDEVVHRRRVRLKAARRRRISRRSSTPNCAPWREPSWAPSRRGTPSSPPRL